ncbi:MAG: DNA polymerase III subunit beta [Betaproteobacteria bacterium]|nr:DNA polymerase III subunit beta [Betaproteobacteria bacterium]
MKLVQAKRDDLLRPLQAVSGIVEKRHTLPILSNVLFERVEEQVHLLATDLEIQVITSFTSSQKGAENYQITVSARKLQDILRALPEQADVTLEIQNNRMLVRSGKSRFTLQTLPAEDFPKLAQAAGEAVKLKITQKELRSLLLLVQYAMAQQDIRYYLNGMLLVLEGSVLKVVATDGHRLAYASMMLPQKAGQQEVILPRKAVQELIKLLNENEDEVRMDLTPTQVKFGIGEVEFTTKVVDGKFPDYTRVIPTNYQKRFEIDRNILQQALQRVAILSNEKFRGVRWTFTEGQLRITCTNTEQEEAFEELEIPHTGEALDIGFNVTYLLDVLNNLTSEKVICSFGDANSSVLITIAEDSDFRYVVMPMRI